MGCKTSIILGMCACLPVQFGQVSAQDLSSQNLNFNGVPGIIDMPSGFSMPDGEISTTVAFFGAVTRNTLSFQISDRLGGSFRYSATRGWINDGFDTYYDRSFDIRYRVLDESRYLPAVTIGLQDFVGTGIYSAEYIAATKHFGADNALRVTGGLGWGRLGTYNSFSNPFGLDDRPTGFEPTGGSLNADRWFRGPVSLFGGVEWQATDRLRVMAEYSSDAFIEEASRGLIDRRSPFNFGVNYQVTRGVDLGLYYLYGSEVGARLSFSFNPNRSEYGAGAETAPSPVNVRSAGRVAALSWPDIPAPTTATQEQSTRATAEGFAREGLELESLRIDGARAVVRFRNDRFNVAAQALGRASRVLTWTLPSSVQEFELIPVQNGLPLASVLIARTDLEEREHAADAGAALFREVSIRDAFGAGPRGIAVEGVYPRLSWDVSPYISTLIFGLDNPLRADAGVRLRGRYDFAPGLSVSGSLRQRVLGNIADDPASDSSVLPPVRTGRRFYDAEGGPVLENLTVDYMFRPGRNLFGRVSAGYFERMFGGVSAELLWAPVSRPYAIGAEVNYVAQRDFDQGLGFQDYSVATGHVSGYYSFGNGYHAQVDVGRYLAGDWGATVSLDREFSNGWRVGAFMTLTDVSFEDFGDGSFDKGIRVTIPVGSLMGQPSRNTTDVTIRPFLRDGGARLNVNNRLYESVRGYRGDDVAQTWGRFLR